MFRCRSGGASLYLLDPDSNEIVERQTFFGLVAQSFTFSPDMSQFVQENRIGGGLSDKLLLVSTDKSVKELLPDFQRARSPAWSADGKTIAFAGTKESPVNKELTSEQDIERLFFYPWDIYLMHANGSNPRILLPLVGTIYGLKWSPTNENLLLFGGNSFNHVPGIWLLDITNMSVKRIWNKNSLLDWSPDGSKIVLLDDATDVWWRSVKIINIKNTLER
jgi:Tol biopolymer transport system component